MALASRPRLLLLTSDRGNEPGRNPDHDGPDREARQRTHRHSGRTQDETGARISDRILVLHHGELLAEGTPLEVRQNEAVKRSIWPAGALIRCCRSAI